MSEESYVGRYNAVMPYLIIPNASRFSDFMKNVFGATEIYRAMRDDKIIMHAEIKIGDTIIMFADANDQWHQQNAGMFICVDDADTTFNKAIQEGATVVTPLSDQSYGRTGGVKDLFGNTWWITKVK